MGWVNYYVCYSILLASLGAENAVVAQFRCMQGAHQTSEPHTIEQSGEPWRKSLSAPIDSHVFT